MTRPLSTITHRSLITLGVTLWVMVGALVVQHGANGLFTTEEAGAFPQNFTTCSTYKPDTGCGGIDCGTNQPFAPDGGVDTDCSTPATGNNICQNGAYAQGCICQEDVAACNLSPNPVPVDSNVFRNPSTGEWTTAFEWWVSQPTTTEAYVVYVRADAPITNPWECVYGGPPTCAPFINTLYLQRNATHIVQSPPGNATENISWYYGTNSAVPGAVLKSEIRQFDTFVLDYTLSVTPPGDKSIVTGEQSDWYTVTVTPQGGATGPVTLSVGNWSPAINGVTVNWEGGTNVVNLPPSGSVQKRFRLQTDDGTPPTVPPVTLPDVYDFRVSGQHATLGTKFQDLADGLTVQDFRMSTTTTTLTMDATDSDSFTVNMQWLPGAEPFGNTVNLTATNLAGLTTTFNPASPIDNSRLSFQVNLSTVNASPGSYAFIVTGTGTNPGALVRQVQITLNINGPPDFTWNMSPEQVSAPVGGSTVYTITANAINSPVGGMVIQLGSTAFRWPLNPDVPPSIGMIFKQGAAEITQITLPASGNPVTFSLEVYPNALADCDSNPDPEYAIRATGTYNPGPSQIQKEDTDNLEVVCAAVPSFTMSANPVTQSVAQGGTATYQVTVTSVNGFNDTVDLWQLITCPTGASCNYPASVVVAPAAPAVFNFVVITNNPATPLGNYSMQLFGRGRGDPSKQASVTMTLVVTSGPDYTFTVQPTPLTIDEGTQGTYTVQVLGSGGFSTPIRFTWVMNPASGLIGFNPVSGNLTVTPGNSGSIDVSAAIGSSGTYNLDFTATPQGAGTVKYLNGVQLIVGSVICSGNCQNICVDSENVPVVPNVFCPTGNECDTIPGARCASQTCRGVGGCQPDPLPGPNDCNDSSCYDASGNFITPPTNPLCYQSWPRCQAFEVLKVRKDRQCDKWLSCEDAVVYTDPISQKEVAQCLNLGVCNQLGPTGECMSFLPTANKDNIAVSVPADVTGATSKIRWLSGYSAGFAFTSAGTIEGSYPQQVIEEVGLDGSTATDLVRNGTFEELRCNGGGRDGLSCVVSSDCRVGTGVCAQFDDPSLPGVVVRTPCTQDVECADVRNYNGTITTPFCRYLITNSEEISCRNPQDAVWLGIVPPGTGTEAGLDDAEDGIKNNAAGAPAVRFQIREDNENFRTLSASDARHPLINGIAEDHLKDGNNFLRVRIEPEADKFSGVGVPIIGGIADGGTDGYVVSFKFRYVNTGTTPDTIKAQLGFNYTATGALAYQNTSLRAFDFPAALDVGQCQGGSRNGLACIQNVECPGGSCTIDLDIKGTTEWQTFVLGPIYPSGFNTALTPFLSFVTNSDLNNEEGTIFELDDVTLKPALDFKKSGETPIDTLKLARQCRLFPRIDSPECEYFDENGTKYLGWRGYCMDKDPQNKDLCLTWWPLDLLAGETPFTGRANVGYDDRTPLYYCAQAEGGELYHEEYFSGCRFQDDRCRLDFGGTDIRWRDVERIELLVDANDNEFERDITSTYKADAERGGPSSSEFKVLLHQNIDTSANLWGYGGACIRDDSDCREKFDQGWSSVWDSDCDSGSDKGWIAMGVEIDNDDPDNENAKVSSVKVHLCHDMGGDFDNDVKVRILVYARQSCNAITEVVRSSVDGSENKAWTRRTDQTSTYTIPDLGFGYLSDKSPFGGIAGRTGDPTSWGNYTFDKDLLTGFSATESTPDGNERAGTPLSCRRDCGTNASNAKYCYSPAQPPGACDDANCATGTSNRCETRADIAACNSATAEGPAYCVGRPLGRCTGNKLLACANDGDCGLVGAGTCTDELKSAGQNSADYTYARDHLKRIFAKSYACYELRSRIINTGTDNILQTYYVNGCSKPGGTWDIATDGPGGGPIYCPASGRPLDDPATPAAEDYCAVRPSVTSGTFLVGGASSGDIVVNVGQQINGGFSYTIDAEQRPMKNGTILWDWNGSGSPEAACAGAALSGSPDTGTVSSRHTYSSTGTFTPLACVIDNWEIVGAQAFNGTITVE